MTARDHKRLRQAVRLIAASDRRKRKRGWRIYRDLNRKNLRALSASFKTLGVAASRAAVQVQDAMRQLQATLQRDENRLAIAEAFRVPPELLGAKRQPQGA